MITDDVKKRAATYLRVSRSDQSSALQEDETSSFISRRGWDLVSRFSDEGFSGRRSKRPGLEQLRQAARRRAFDVLVVYRGDRLFRSLADFLALLNELAELGVEYVSVTEPFDSTIPSGRLMMQLVAAFAEFECAILRERTRDGVAAARRRGKRLGRPPRSIDMLAVRDLRGRGRTMKQIAEKLGVGLNTLKRAVYAERAERAN